MLIFSLEDLSIFDSGVLKSHTVIVLLSIYFFMSYIFIIFLGASMLGAYVFTIFMSSWCIFQCVYYEVTFWVSLYGPFGILFCLIFVLLPLLFFLSMCLENLFQPFTFSLCKSFVLRWVSCRQHMSGSCFLIHSAILCLLIGALNPFTFKVIIDRKLFIAIFSYLCSSVFLFSFLSLKQSL